MQNGDLGLQKGVIVKAHSFTYWNGSLASSQKAENTTQKAENTTQKTGNTTQKII